MGDEKDKIAGALRLAVEEGKPVCRHGLGGPCVQCDPWCPRDVSPEWVARMQPLYERARLITRSDGDDSWEFSARDALTPLRWEP